MRPDDIVEERFEIVEEVCHGGMGTIFRGHDRQNDSPVAVKLLRGESDIDAHRFRREATLLAQLHHPAVVRYISHGETPSGELYLIQQWLRGHTLAEHLFDHGLAIEESIAAVRRTAGALAVAHAMGIVHRDIKPDNLFLDQGQPEQIKVLDFGIALPHGQGFRITNTGIMVGTPSYMSPEQARGDREITARADIFGLGCVFYECLTGAVAFAGTTTSAVCAKVLRFEPEPVHVLCPFIPVELGELVARMLAKDPDMRPASTTQLIHALDALPAMPAATQRRPQRALQVAQPTIRVDSASAPDKQFTCVVLAAMHDTETTQAAAIIDHLERSGALAGGDIDIIHPDAMILLRIHQGDIREQASRGAHCALELWRTLPKATIAIASGYGPEAVLDRGTQVAQAERSRSIFARLRSKSSPSSITLDELTASLIDTDFTIERSASRYYLVTEERESQGL